MTHTGWLVIVLALALGACFSRPGKFASGDAGTGSDAPIDAVIDAPIDAPPTLVTGPITAGAHHACAIDATSRLWCWGDNTSGQIGPDGGAASGTPVLAVPSMPDQWTKVAAGSAHTCGLRAGTVYCWGRNGRGQAGGNNSVNPIVLPGGAAAALDVFAGNDGSCAIDAQQRLYCWGTFDPEDNTVVASATQVSPGGVTTGWRQIAIGTHHACAVLTTDAAYCWGQNSHQQLGSSTADASVSIDNARLVAGSYAQLVPGPNMSCGISMTSQLVCFGDGSGGLVANLTADDLPPTVVDSPVMWTRVSIGSDHVCGVGNGVVRCYGDNSLGALGDRYEAHRLPANVTLPGGATPLEIVSGTSFSCALDSSSRVDCWGVNRNGELGVGHIATTRTPLEVALGLGPNDVIAEITAGEGHSCALINVAGASPGVVKCWGDNRSAQVDSNTTSFAEVPRVAATNMLSISAGGHHTCGLGSNGNAVCWGLNTSSQTGHTGTNGKFEVTPPAADTWATVSAGSTASCATTATTKDLWCWGNVWTVPPSNRSMKTMVNNPANAWSRVVLGSGFGVGIIDATNEPGGFGDGCKYGALADHDPTNTQQMFSSLPVPFEITAAQGSGEHVCVHRTTAGDPVVTCWGRNNQKAINTSATGCSELQLTEPLPANVIWTQPAPQTIAVAGGHSCAIADIDTTSTVAPRLYCWGANNDDVLGFQPLNNGVPSETSATLSVSRVATGPNHICVVGRLGASNPGVYCWGDNRYGEVGNGFRFHETPVHVAIP